MSYEESIELTIAGQRKVAAVQAVNDDFLEAVAARPVAVRLNARLQIEDGALHCSCYGYRLESRPRVVALVTGHVAVEYAFYAREHLGRIIWSFYVLEDRAVHFRPATDLCESVVRIEINAPALVEGLLLHLHAASWGTLAAPADTDFRPRC